MSGQSPLGAMRTGRAPIYERPGGRRRAARRRRWPIVAAGVIAVIVVAAGWWVLWRYAAGVADHTLAGWVQREAAAGRAYSCGTEQISGFPFRILARCTTAAATIDSMRPPFTAAAKEMSFTAQIWRPTELVGEITGPLTIAPVSAPPSLVATWSRARLRLQGLPPNPDAFTISIEQSKLDRPNGGADATLFAADSTLLQGRIIAGSAENHPVIEATLHVTSASAPTLHPLLASPLNGDVDAVVSGLTNLSPKSWPDSFREMQAAGGKIEIKSLRIERADALILGTGTLHINEHGRLDGQLRIGVVGIEKIVPLLGIDRAIDQGINKLAGGNGAQSGLAILDQLVPGLGGAIAQNANATVIDSLKKMGQPTELENKPAIVLPLRLSDGAAYIGMIPLGTIPPLF